MIYRILMSILLVICICVVGVALEPDTPKQGQAPSSYTPSPDDGAMKSLRIN